jgi:hypothetical protein
MAGKQEKVGTRHALSLQEQSRGRYGLKKTKPRPKTQPEAVSGSDRQKFWGKAAVIK